MATAIGVMYLRPPRRGRAGARAVRQPAASLHAHAARRGARPRMSGRPRASRSRARSPTRSIRRRAAPSIRAALRVRALPARGAGNAPWRGVPRGGGGARRKRTVQVCGRRLNQGAGIRRALLGTIWDRGRVVRYWPWSTAITMMAVSASPHEPPGLCGCLAHDRQREGHHECHERAGAAPACSLPVPLIANARISASANAPRKPRRTRPRKAFRSASEAERGQRAWPASQYRARAP